MVLGKCIVSTSSLMWTKLKQGTGTCTIRTISTLTMQVSLEKRLKGVWPVCTLYGVGGITAQSARKAVMTGHIIL